MDMTHLGAIICSYNLCIIGAIFRNTVPAITITSASRGVPRITSPPNRAISYRLVRAVAISTKQQDRPKPNGQSEFFLPQEIISSSLPSNTDLPISSILAFPDTECLSLAFIIGVHH